MKAKDLLLTFATIAIFIQAKKHKVDNKFDKPISSDANYNIHHSLFKNSDSINLLSKPNVSTIIDEPFNNYTDNGWTIYNVAGAQGWSIIVPFGNPAPAAIMNGFGGVNEDWLISKNINLTNGYESASFSFQTDASFIGIPLEVYVTTDAYVNGEAPDSVVWTKLDAILDSDLTGYHGFVPSGDISLANYIGKNIRIAFKYVNASSTTATSWEIDNFKVVATENLSISNTSFEQMKFYPNPVKDVLNFSEEVSNVKITDISGQLVSETAFKGRSFDLSKLKKGVYILIVTVKSGRKITYKIGKE